MPANTIDTSFVKQFETEVHQAFQRMGAMLRDTTRLKTGVKGSSTTFQKIGTGTASSKTRNSQVSLMNVAHTLAEATITDYYAAEMVDKLDEYKVQHDERAALSNAIAWALGRAYDDLIIARLNAATGVTVHGSAALTLSKLQIVYQTLGTRNVPNDGQRFAAISPGGYVDLLEVQQFSSADYVGGDQMFKKAGKPVRNWYSFNWMEHSALPLTSNVRTALFWHKSSIGMAENQYVSVDVTWQGKEQAHLLVGSLSFGGVLIDDNGVYRVEYQE